MSDSIGKIRLFESQHIRSEWDAEAKKWWFSVLDVVSVLTEQPDYKKVRNYWKWLKNKLIAEGSQWVSNTNPLKLTASDGKKYLTDVIYKAWAGKSAKEYKQHKDLKKENLRDNMTNTDLVMNMLVELSSKEISEVVQPQTLPEYASVAKQARLKLEAETGKKVVSSQNAKQMQLLGKTSKKLK